MAARSEMTTIGEPLHDPPLANTAAVAASDSKNQSKQNASTADKTEAMAFGDGDLENQAAGAEERRPKNVSAFKSLGWLDRFLAGWIFLAMAVGIILGNFVPETGPALEKGKFVGVSVPIGMCLTLDMENGRPSKC